MTPEEEKAIGEIREGIDVIFSRIMRGEVSRRNGIDQILNIKTEDGKYGIGVVAYEAELPDFYSYNAIDELGRFYKGKSPIDEPIAKAVKRAGWKKVFMW